MRLTILSFTAAVAATLLATNRVSADEPRNERGQIHSQQTDALAFADDRNEDRGRRDREPDRRPDNNDRRDNAGSSSQPRGPVDQRRDAQPPPGGRDNAGPPRGDSNRGPDRPEPQVLDALGF